MAAVDIPPGCCEYPSDARYRPTAATAARVPEQFHPFGPELPLAAAIARHRSADAYRTALLAQLGAVRVVAQTGGPTPDYEPTKPPLWFGRLIAKIRNDKE